jgi:hypothetical protein
MLGKHALMAGAVLASPLLLLPAMPTERPHLPRTPGAAVVRHSTTQPTDLAGTAKVARTTQPRHHSQLVAISLRHP